MKSILVRNSSIPKALSWFFPVAAITLWPFILIRPGYDTDRLINHEKIHIVQYNELLVLGFLLLYLWDWVVGLLKYRSTKTAYYQIRFEQEARFGEGQEDYLEKRPKHSWLRFKV